MRKSKVTIRDVAKAAGVHISTASRALNSQTQHLITADVVERVRSVARKLDYRANAFASGLRTKRSNAIGLLIPDLWNPAFPAIVAGVQEVVVREGYEITIASDENSSERHATVIESMLSRQVDGLILATATLKDRAITDLASRNIPAVMVNRRDEQGRTSSVISDDERGIALAVEHLVSLGHRDICHIGGPQNLSTGVTRLRGFVKAMKDHDLKVPDKHVEIAASYSRADGARAAHQLFAQNRRPTAIVVANDLLALGCYDAPSIRRDALPGRHINHRLQRHALRGFGVASTDDGQDRTSSDGNRGSRIAAPKTRGARLSGRRHRTSSHADTA